MDEATSFEIAPFTGLPEGGIYEAFDGSPEKGLSFVIGLADKRAQVQVDDPSSTGRR